MGGSSFNLRLCLVAWDFATMINSVQCNARQSKVHGRPCPSLTHQGPCRRSRSVQARQNVQPPRRGSHPLTAPAVPQSAQADAAASTSGRSSPDPTEDVSAAWAFLKDFSVKTFRGLGAQYTATPEKRAQLGAALKLAYSHPWPAAAWVPPRQPTADASPTTSTSATDSSAQQGSSEDTPAGTGETELPPALVMIGLMASDVRVAARAMRDYCQALGLPYSKPESRVPGVSQAASVQGVVYMKYNSVSKVCYVVSYLGKERGVLIQMGQEQLGHFPLGLWDEEMKAPAPEL